MCGGDQGRYLISTSNLYTHVCEQLFLIDEKQGDWNTEKKTCNSMMWDYLGDGGEEKEEGGKSEW